MGVILSNAHTWPRSWRRWRRIWGQWSRLHLAAALRPWRKSQESLIPRHQHFECSCDKAAALLSRPKSQIVFCSLLCGFCLIFIFITWEWCHISFLLLFLLGITAVPLSLTSIKYVSFTLSLQQSRIMRFFLWSHHFALSGGDLK